MRMMIARAIMTVTARGLGEARREWALAMRAEFDTAVEHDEALQFALGCLLAAWRTMPSHDEGRFVLARHMLAVGVVIPVAALQISSVLLGLPYPTLGSAGADVLLSGSAGQVIPVNDANRSAIPALALLTLSLGVGHLYLAWTMLKQDWERVAVLLKLGAAGAVTLIAFTTVVFLGESRVVLQVALMTTEIAVVCSLARWAADLPPATTP